MNERNVDALARIIRQMASGWIGWDKEGKPAPLTMSIEEWAEALAVRGVLVPAALTDEDFDLVYDACERAGLDVVAVMRAALERIAKGET